jgi:hypothetical protein
MFFSRCGTASRAVVFAAGALRLIQIKNLIQEPA